MRYAILENDAHSLRRMKEACDKLRPEWDLVFTSPSIAEGLVSLERYPDIDLLISDIELDDGIVFTLFKKRVVECPVIFVTAFDEYTLDAFKLFSIDYIMKPIDRNELERAFLKYERIERKLNVMNNDVLSRLSDVLAKKDYIKRILIATGDHFDSIPVENIGCFISEDKYVFAVPNAGTSRITSFKSLNDLEELLDPEIFFRVSRECIVTFGVIKKVSRWFKGRLSVKIECGDIERDVVISSARRNDFLDWYGK